MTEEMSSCLEKTPFLKFDNFGQINVTTAICSEIYCKTVGSIKSLNVAFLIWGQEPKIH